MPRISLGISLALSGAFAFAQPAFRIQTIAGSSFAGDGGLATQAILQQAEGIAVDSDGTLYIADAADHRIRAVSPKGDIRTIAGDGSPGFDGDGGLALKAHLNSPYGLALDRQGNLYVADLGNARIRVIAPNGTIRTVAGGGALPASDANEGTTATDLQLKTPRNVLADPNGGFYFSDFDAHRVYSVDARGILAVFAGTGSPGYGADNVTATRSALRNPAGLAFEPLGGVIIVESGAQRLRRVARGIITTYLGDALRNYPLYSPTGVAFDPAGNMYIADARATGALKRAPQGEVTALPLSGRAVAADPRGGAYYCWNAAVYRVDPANKSQLAAGTAAGLAELTGDGGGAETARLLAPAGLAYDRDGNLYIADERAHRIRRVTPAGLITTIAGTGKAAYSGDAGPAVKAGLNVPRSLAFDPFGNLYVADTGNHTIRVIAPSGTITTAAGNGFPGYRGDGGPGTAAQLNFPSGVAVDSNGDIFIADTANHRVRRLSRAGIITTYAGSGIPGVAYEGSAAIFAQLNEPRGLAFDSAGNLYIADSANNRIRRIDLTGLLSTIGTADLTSPRAVAVAPGGGIFVADTGKHRICMMTDSITVKVAGNGTPGFRGDGGPAVDAQFQFPAALAFDSLGNLAIADLGNGRVRQLRPEAVLISVLEQGPRIANAASNAEGTVAPGMLATLRGEAFGASEPASATLTDKGWPKLLADVDVYVDGEAAPLLYVSATQINLQIPASVAGRSTADIQVFHRGTLRAKSSAAVAAAVPGVFAAAVNENGSVNSALNPAARGSISSLYATGTGILPTESIEIRVGAMTAQLIWAGPAPGIPGLTQVNFRLPTGFYPPGGQPVSFKIGAIPAPPGLSVYLQ
ncbi:MAG: hypothetical protein HYX27_08125 [Acidobacteria bacterium]|nr:hypothetical protein [Acidobacteriota bacterium]